MSPATRRPSVIVNGAWGAAPSVVLESQARAEGCSKIKVVIHEPEESGFWAEVPAIPGCATQGESMEELLANVREEIEACLSVEVDQPERTGKDRILEIAV